MIEPCACRLCDEGPVEDEHEEKVLHDVQQHYVHIVWVPEGDGSDEPTFAYTVGLRHQARHPELLMSGQKPALMHASLNAAVDWVRSGHRLVPGLSMEGVIGGFPVAVEELTRHAIDETATFSQWFHRRQVDALQLVWTDLHGVWPWQPGAHELVRERQPELWRVPGPRVGALANDPDWVLPAPADAMVFSCVHLEAGATVALVTRESHDERSEEWQVLCDEEHAELASDAIRLGHLSHLVRAAPSLRELADLQLDERATRRHPWDPWERSPIEPAPDPEVARPEPSTRWWQRRRPGKSND